MTSIYNILKSVSLFENISPSKYKNVLCCLKAELKKYEKDEIIYDYHDPIESAGIVLQGKVIFSYMNKTGSEHCIRQFGKGELFAVAYACLPTEQNAFQVIASEKSKVLLFNPSQLFMKKINHCPYASQIALNLLQEMAGENIFLSRKVEILTQKKIRDKFCVYLRTLDFSGSSVLLPFNRQGLANYLDVERSALSRELCSMRDEGLIEFKKNSITILNKDFLQL